MADKKPLPKFDKASRSNLTRSVKDTKRKKKTFSVSEYANSEKGKKIILYAETGMGKTTLAGTAPDPVFICPDRGIEDLDHPLDGKWNAINGVDTFDDLRDVTQDISLFKAHKTAVFDTGSVIQNKLCVPHVLENVKKEKGGYAKNINDYGWGDGYAHIFNHMVYWQSDLDALVDAGVNVIVLCQLAQTKKTDATHGEHWCAYPDLLENLKGPVMSSFTAWANYIFKIDWATVEIDDSKIGVSSDDRAVFVKPEYSFKAKHRGSMFEEYPVVEFEDKSDQSLWNIMFGDGDGE